MTKGVTIKDLTTGTGEEATRESVVVVNVRKFLRRGDEVSPSPLFGTRMVMDLGRRECIAGLRYGIPGMRVGGTREIVISPHLAYGEKGMPDLIPPNALLRCEVELLEIREHSGVRPEDWLAGKVLFIRHYEDTNNRTPGWDINMHESGNLHLTLHERYPGVHPNDQPYWRLIPIFLDREKSTDLIRQAIELPTHIPEDCLLWNSGMIDMPRGNGVITDNRNGARCMVVQVRERQEDLLMIGVPEDSPKFRDSAFYRTVEQLVSQHFSR